MKKNEIKVGGIYSAKVSDKLTQVRVDQILTRRGIKKNETHYAVTNLATGRKTTFRSAAKFREELEVTLYRATLKDSLPGTIQRERLETLCTEATEVEEHIGEGEPTDDDRRENFPEYERLKKANSVPAIIKKALAPSILGGVKINQTPSSSQAPHLEVSALAGTGKTTTVIEGVKNAKGVRPAVKPSPQQEAVWESLKLGKSDSVRLSAFNTGITDELKGRILRDNLQSKGVEAKGVHSMGYGAVNKAFGYQNPSQYQHQDLIARIMGGDPKQLKRDKDTSEIILAADELVGLCKQTLSDPSEDNLDSLCSHYDIEIKDKDKQRVYDIVPQVLELSKEPNGTISFDDMVWLPVTLGLSIYKVDLQIIDESQDLNRMQQQLIYKAGHRIVYVGDRRQAIYGFAGADAESMDRMGKELAATPRGQIVLPLTVTRRCGKAIVAEAKKLVPEFEAHESNCDGIVSEGVYPIRPKSSNPWLGQGQRELPWEKTYCAMVRPGDFVLCRVNAPLVSQCFRFLRRGMKANILGRKIGDGLISMVNKSKAKTTGQLIGWVSEWLGSEMKTENAKKFPSEQRLIMLQDKHDCLVCFCEGLATTDQVVEKIRQIFTDDKSAPGILFSSIHKSKGLEAKRVFFLQPEGAGCPHPMARKPWEIAQEWNLKYVAITRAIEELVYVS